MWSWLGALPTLLFGFPDLKAFSQAPKASSATQGLSPAVEQMQPVMASDLPATPGRTSQWESGVGAWEGMG